MDADDTEELYIFAQGERYHEADRQIDKGEEMNIFNIRSWNDVVAMLYSLIPLATVALVGYGAFKEDQVMLWAGVATSALQLILEFKRTQDFARRVVYTILGIANTVLIAYVAGWNPEYLTVVMPLLAAILGGGPGAVALQNVNTTGDEAKKV